MLRISTKYKQRPSEVADIEDKYTAFCFDEACEYILSMRTINEKGQEVWIKEPRWIDGEYKGTSNSSLIAEMKENLKKY